MAFSQKQFLAVALAVIVFLILVFSFGSQQPSGAQPTPSPKASVVSLNSSYYFGDSSISVSETLGNEKNFLEETTVSNEGSTTARMGFLDVVPPSLSEGAGFDTLSEEKPVATEFLSLNPLVRYIVLELEKGDVFSSRLSLPRRAEEFPLHLLAGGGLEGGKKNRLTDLSKRIAGLGLGEAEAGAFEKKFNDAYAEHRRAGKTFDEFLGSARLFTAEVHAKKNSGEFLATTPAERGERLAEEIREIVFPPPLPTPIPISPELYPTLPEEITVSVSEGEPLNSSEFFLKSVSYLGELLLRLEGEAAEYASAETRFLGGGYSLAVSADLSDVELENCLFPFDELSGYADFMFVSLPGTVKRVPFRIVVNHFNVCEDLEKNELASADDTHNNELEKTKEDDAAVGKLTENVLGTDAVWGWPADGKITSVWNDCRDGCTRLHQGIDIQGAVGDSVYAIDDGVAEVARNYEVSKNVVGWRCGKYVKLRHASGERSLYCHLSRVDVKAGQSVSKCAVIGAVGRTGNAASTPPHLHFEIRKTDGKPTNPLRLLGKKADYCVAQT